MVTVEFRGVPSLCAGPLMASSRCSLLARISLLAHAARSQASPCTQAVCWPSSIVSHFQLAVVYCFISVLRGWMMVIVLCC
ncbi:uncharacterized protein [Zea mays]|uniref:uncharacterized protein isoform X2 n=1 Tax=Zea mays TaxID=4577 RepID=UPI000C6C5A14|nr:uncharacterized protein LOC103632381 isoform X2 [Zea mays]|eukprot:XP_023156484.1 uncharacterized protein LOC103632381 isoform X2 [Zea mays]